MGEVDHTAIISQALETMKSVTTTANHISVPVQVDQPGVPLGMGHVSYAVDLQREEGGEWQAKGVKEVPSA